MGTACSPEESRLIWARTVEVHSTLTKSRRRHSLGVDFLLRYLEWDCALYKSLREFGLDKEHAGALVETINWAALGPAIRVFFSFSRLRSAVLKTRVRWVLDMMFRALFTHPFRRRVLPSDEGLAFDVTVCPLAQFFREQGVPELTHYAACSLDWKMARDWGVELKRTRTIAEDHPLCDFRFKVPPRQTPKNPRS